MKSDYVRINREAFDFLAERYAKIEKELGYPNSLVENFYRYLIDNFHNPSVLEIGCGSAFTLRYFSERGFRTTAIDISSKMIKIAKRKSPNTYFIHSDFLSHNFEDEKFPGVCVENVLHLFPFNKIRSVFDKIHYLLYERGIIYFSIPLFDKFGEELISRGEKDPVLEFRTKYTKEKIIQILENSNFKTMKEVVVPFRDSKGNNLSRLNTLLIK